MIDFGSPAGRVAVIGLGSVLMQDDAAGPHVLCRLEAELDLPPGVELLDLGTPGPELAHIIEGLDALIVIDTLRLPGAEPGEVRLLRKEEILRGRQPERLSPHDPSLRGALVAADLLGRAPAEVLLIGIVPSEVHLGLGLTPAVKAALPKAVESAAAELARLGIRICRRPVPQDAEVWWEKGAAATAALSSISAAARV